MKKNKQLDRLIDKAVIASFAGDRLNRPKVLSLVSSFKKLSKIEAIYMMNKYLEGIKRETSKTTLEIESPTALSQKQIKDLVSALKADYQITNVILKVDPTLLAGVRVRLGDLSFEDTILSRIEKLKEVIIG